MRVIKQPPAQTVCFAVFFYGIASDKTGRQRELKLLRLADDYLVTFFQSQLYNAEKWSIYRIPFRKLGSVSLPS